MGPHLRIHSNSGGLHLTDFAVGCTKRRGRSAGSWPIAMPKAGKPVNNGKTAENLLFFHHLSWKIIVKPE